VIFFYAGVFLAAGVAGFFGAGFSFFAIGVELTFFGTTAAFAFVAGVAFSFLGTGVAFVFFAGALADKTTGVATGIAVEATIRAGALGAGAGGACGAGSDLDAVTTFEVALAAGLF
jgi:hypothetical protein